MHQGLAEPEAHPIFLVCEAGSLSMDKEPLAAERVATFSAI
jgi:hypothetical protein